MKIKQKAYRSKFCKSHSDIVHEIGAKLISNWE